MKQLILLMALGFLVHTGLSQSMDPSRVQDNAPEVENMDVSGQADSSALLLEAEDGISNGLYFSEIYPNPANNEAVIDYQLKHGHPKVRFTLFNFLGAKEQEIEITENAGSLRLNTSGLTEGIYFYSLLIDNESLLTQKLIIKH